MSVYVRFEAEIRLYDNDVPERLSYAEVAQAVQNIIGHTGAAGVDVLEYEHDGITSTTSDGPQAVAPSKPSGAASPGDGQEPGE